jgi:selenocysteine lyase/cysteine desulfurase
MVFDSTIMKEIRDAFPRAHTSPDGKRRVYLDNGTGTLVLKCSADAQHEAALEWGANPGDSFPESRHAEKFMNDGLAAVADLLNADSPDNILSGQTATSLMFALSYAIGKEIKPSQNIVTTFYEHLSNISPWQELVRRGCAKELRFAKLRPDGTLDMEHLRSIVDENTRVVTISAASNLLGSKTDLVEAGKIAHRVGAYYIVDAVHHSAHGPLDVNEIGCDFLVISAYKLFTPKYISFLYGRREYLENMSPYSAGKGHANIHSKWHWGSPDQAKYAAVSATIDYLARLGGRVEDRYKGKYTGYTGRRRLLKIAMDVIDAHEKEISHAVIRGVDGVPGLTELPNVRLYGLYDPDRLEERDPTFAFSMKNLSGKDAERFLVEKHSIAMRSMLYWSMAEDFFDIELPLRASFVHYNTIEEVRMFLEAVRDMGKA